MPGVLSMSAHGGQRRRYDAGGSVMPVPPIPPQGGPPPPAALGAPQQGGQSPGDDVPALSAAAGQPNQDTADQARRIDMARQRILESQNILRAGGIAPPSWQQPGATNLPMLLAASGMLGPTRTGGFAESLGNAFSGAGQGIEAQRKMEMDEALRRAQLQETAAYREGILGVRGQHEDSYAQRANTDMQLAQVRSSELQARAALETARAAGAAAGHATEGDLMGATVRSLVGSKDENGNPALGPDNRPWTPLTALQAARTTQGALANADLRGQGLDIQRQTLDLRRQALANAESDHEKSRIAHSTDADLARAVSIRNADAAVGGKMTLHDALGQVENERAGLPGALPKLPTSPAAGGTAPAVAATTTAPAAPPAAAGVKIPPRPAAVPMGSSYSPSMNKWKSPDGRIFDGAS